jgi:hypothetical protein
MAQPSIFDRIDLPAPAPSQPSPAQPDQELFAQLMIQIHSHPAREVCQAVPCQLCSLRDCPFQNPLHWSHDGPCECQGVTVVEILGDLTRASVYFSPVVLPAIHPE